MAQQARKVTAAVNTSDTIFITSQVATVCDAIMTSHNVMSHEAVTTRHRYLINGGLITEAQKCYVRCRNLPMRGGRAKQCGVQKAFHLVIKQTVSNQNNRPRRRKRCLSPSSHHTQMHQDHATFTTGRCAPTPDKESPLMENVSIYTSTERH